jgi:hypothetical protein
MHEKYPAHGLNGGVPLETQVMDAEKLLESYGLKGIFIDGDLNAAFLANYRR